MTKDKIEKPQKKIREASGDYAIAPDNYNQGLSDMEEWYKASELSKEEIIEELKIHEDHRYEIEDKDILIQAIISAQREKRSEK